MVGVLVTSRGAIAEAPDLSWDLISTHTRDHVPAQVPTTGTPAVPLRFVTDSELLCRIMTIVYLHERTILFEIIVAQV
jgi:hypothetical protein